MVGSGDSDVSGATACTGFVLEYCGVDTSMAETDQTTMAAENNSKQAVVIVR